MGRIHLLRRSLRIPIKQRKRMTIEKIYSLTLEIAKRRCVLEKINQKDFTAVLRKLFSGFSEKQLYFLSLFFPQWYVMILIPRNKKITFGNFGKYKKVLVNNAKVLSGSSFCPEWGIICDGDCNMDCDIYQADILSTASIKSKLEGKDV